MSVTTMISGFLPRYSGVSSHKFNGNYVSWLLWSFTVVHRNVAHTLHTVINIISSSTSYTLKCFFTTWMTAKLVGYRTEPDQRHQPTHEFFPDRHKITFLTSCCKFLACTCSQVLSLTAIGYGSFTKSAVVHLIRTRFVLSYFVLPYFIRVYYVLKLFVCSLWETQHKERKQFLYATVCIEPNLTWLHCRII